MNKSNITRLLLFSISVLGVAALVFVFFRFNPENSNLFPKCIFLQLTGYKCPGCGSQRAIHSLLNLHIAEAFRYNALLVSMIPLIALMFLAIILRKKFPKFYNLLNSIPLIIFLLCITILWWILRNICGW